jgi:hypothetical protein
MRLANNPRIASCMQSPPYLLLAISNLFETTPNPPTNYSSTTTTPWSTGTVAPPLFCPLVSGGRRREERSTKALPSIKKV